MMRCCGFSISEGIWSLQAVGFHSLYGDLLWKKLGGDRIKLERTGMVVSRVHLLDSPGYEEAC